MASPGWKQVWPKRAACWSPAAPVIGISPPRSDGAVVPNRPLEGSGFGSMERGMFSSARISSSQSSVLMLKSIVREALE